MSLLNKCLEYIKNLVKNYLKKIGEKKFNEYVKEKRNYVATINDFLSDKGTIVLYKDEEYLLCRTETPKSVALASVPTDMCLAFEDDKSRKFKNPINKWLREFFLYTIHLINADTSKMHGQVLIGVTVFKKEQEKQPNIRFHPPVQGPGKDIYYGDYEKCVVTHDLPKKYLDIPSEVFDILNSDIKEQKKKNNE
jgi:hypothetical protein